MAERAFPNVRVRNLVQNRSSRKGARPQLMVLHSTQGSNVRGLADLIGLGRFFDIAAVEASSHVANDAEGQSARYVRDAAKAWTQAFYNPVCLSIEMIGRAEQTSWTDAQVDESARWLARWSRHHGIPLQRGEVSGGRVVRPGVITHESLGALGGGHNDPGSIREGGSFPMNRCIRRARHFRELQNAARR